MKRAALPTLEMLEESELADLENLCGLAIELKEPWSTDRLERFREFLMTGARSQLERLATEANDAWRRLYLARSPKPQAAAPKRVVKAGGWCLQLEHVLCGKPNCSKLHGPYWYGYRVIGGRRRKKYFGADRPTADELAAAEKKLLGDGSARSSPEPSPKKRNGKKRNGGRHG